MSDIKVSKEELLKKANKPAEESMKLHPFYKGKVEIVPKCCVRNIDDFAIWYTPGVAAVCKDIQAHPEKVYEHTNKGNMVAVVSDGTRVLGLGDIGPEAGLPVMEGKGLIFKYLGGVDAFPICLNTKDPAEIIKTVQYLAPSFGGINLEDISQPKCFDILDELRRTMTIPVWHDDQQGTATVCLAGLINALKIVKKNIKDVKIVLFGAGAANIRIGTLYMHYGAKPENLVYVDSKGTLHKGRTDLKDHREKWHMCQVTNGGQIVGKIADALKGADVLSAASTPGPDVIKKEWVATMNKDAICFLTANPIPEMWPWDAKEAGARVVATGRSDFPNQVNNSLGFPGIFRGALDVQAKTITDEMCVAAAEALAGYAVTSGKMGEDYLLPHMDEPQVYIEEAVAVGLKAIEQGVARKPLSEKELRASAEFLIKRAIKDVDVRQKNGIVKLP
ncbi:MAG: malate dehydrogenase [Elusimicrobia bacterium GWA2_61_42]|nr:MAG: malate dehydrogenase [Elusimicrobia bacterium GWA2_61_42]OGR74176.1 MAG: malate dehydrogenase [Elusimicrobia bacterium GWC2_61_25]